MFGRLTAAMRVLVGRPAPARTRAMSLRAAYDAASTNERDAKWWANADALGAKQANNPAIRKRLRERSRYEAANNCYAGGIARTLSDDTVGTGPRLQLLGMDRKDAAILEREFADWCKAVGLADKLRTMRRARVVDGESVATLIVNDALPTAVKLDLRLVEAEQLCQPLTGKFTVNHADGIDYDGAGNPTTYHIMREHPGDSGGMPVWEPIPAKNVIHDFKADRPGQVRGVPELTPALPLFKLLRAYTLATLGAAESIANFAAVAYTDAPGDDGADDVKPLEGIELERNMMTALPRGWKIGQVKPEQPASTFREFKREIVAEIGRIFSMPFIVAAGDSSDSSYASGRMDYECYHRAVNVDRAHMERLILERIFITWVEEAVRIEGYLPQRLRSIRTNWRHQWMWDGWEHVDPAKEANAQATRLASHTTTLADEYAKLGQDWEERLELIAKIKQRQKQLAEQYGITWDPPGQQAQPQAKEDDEEAKSGSKRAA